MLFAIGSKCLPIKKSPFQKENIRSSSWMKQTGTDKNDTPHKFQIHEALVTLLYIAVKTCSVLYCNVIMYHRTGYFHGGNFMIVYITAMYYQHYSRTTSVEAVHAFPMQY